MMKVRFEGRSEGNPKIHLSSNIQGFSSIE
jgi:hypothetical protein